MKKTLAAAAVAALVGAVGTAGAADMYPGGLKEAPAYVPPPLWTGFYIGANVGGAWADLQTTDRFGVFNPVPVPPTPPR